MSTIMPFIHPASLRLSAILFAILFVTGVARNAEGRVDFESQIKPILSAHCYSCHNADDEEGGFIIDRESTLGFLEPGDAEGSDLVTDYLTTDDEDLKMPPTDDGNPLSDAQITLVKTWINEGAKWPEEIEIDAPAEPTKAGVVAAEGDEEIVEKTPAVDSGGQKAAAESVITAQLLKDASGSLHPAAVHLPIGLLLAAGLFAFLSLRGNFVMSDCAYYCLWVGTLGSIAASVTGWFYSPMEHRGDVAVLADLLDMSQPVFWHRAGAIGASVLALLLSLMAMGTRARDPDDGMLWKLGTIVLAGVIGWVGHEGGELTYGKAHYKEVHQVIEAFVPGWNGQEAEAATDVESDVDIDSDASQADVADADEDPAEDNVEIELDSL